MPSEDKLIVEEREYLKAIDDDTALVIFSHVAFKSGFLFDIPSIINYAHEVGAAVLVDLSHSAGVAPIELDRWGVDFAVGCTYKYLNGGPGSPAFLYVRQDLIEAVRSPIWGWWGQHSPFQFGLHYEAAQGIERFLIGAAPVLSLLAIEPALDLIAQAGMEAIREKSIRLTS